MILRDRLKFVLVEPSHAGNIGSAARAIKVMGFHRLAVVSPREKAASTHPEALAFASRATDILGTMEVCDSLDEALKDSELNIAVSAEGREFGPQAMSPETLAARLMQEFGGGAGACGGGGKAPTEDGLAIASPGEGATIAQPGEGLAIAQPGEGPTIAPPRDICLVFGTERTGLPIEIVQRCAWLCAIPTEGEYNSLNLSQAVQVLAYVLGRHQGLLQLPEPVRQPAAEHERWATDASVEGMFSQMESTLISIGFLDPQQPKKLMPRLRRLFARSRLTNKEIDILRGILSKVSRKS